jgi:hypothetical protein
MLTPNMMCCILIKVIIKIISFTFTFLPFLGVLNLSTFETHLQSYESFSPCMHDVKHQKSIIFLDQHITHAYI